MHTLVLALVLATTGGLFAPQGGAKPASGGIAQIAWLGGNWQGQRGATFLEENWMPPSGGLMLAVSRTAQGGKVRTFEFLRIVERDGALVYIAMPFGQRATEFVATSVSASSVTFENRAHDFPKVIRYTLTAPNRLDAVVSDGGQKSETFTFTK